MARLDPSEAFGDLILTREPESIARSGAAGLIHAHAVEARYAAGLGMARQVAVGDAEEVVLVDAVIGREMKSVKAVEAEPQFVEQVRTRRVGVADHRVVICSIGVLAALHEDVAGRRIAVRS